MNEIVNKFLLTEEKFMPEMHLKWPRFTDDACSSLSKIQKFKQTGNTIYI